MVVVSGRFRTKQHHQDLPGFDKPENYRTKQGSCQLRESDKFAAVFFEIIFSETFHLDKKLTRRRGSLRILLSQTRSPPDIDLIIRRNKGENNCWIFCPSPTSFQASGKFCWHNIDPSGGCGIFDSSSRWPGFESRQRQLLFHNYLLKRQK